MRRASFLLMSVWCSIVLLYLDGILLSRFGKLWFYWRHTLNIFLYAYDSFILSLHNILRKLYILFMVLIIYNFLPLNDPVSILSFKSWYSVFYLIHSIGDSFFELFIGINKNFTSRFIAVLIFCISITLEYSYLNYHLHFILLLIFMDINKFVPIFTKFI